MVVYIKYYVEKIIKLFRRHSHIGHRFNSLAHRLCSVCYDGFMIGSKSSIEVRPRGRFTAPFFTEYTWSDSARKSSCLSAIPRKFRPPLR